MFTPFVAYLLMLLNEAVPQQTPVTKSIMMKPGINMQHQNPVYDTIYCLTS